MGILNLTSDSFSNDGIYNDPEAALDRAEEIEEQGADILDIGAESSRPGARQLSEGEEQKRLLPVLKKIIKKIKIPVSIDTYKINTAEKVLAEGAHIINDIKGLKNNSRLAELIAGYKAGVIIMHMRGTPQDMQDNPTYKDVVKEIIDFLKKAVDLAVKSGIAQESIVIDPGLGFGKKLEHNLEIIKNLKRFKEINKPVLLGPSNKSFIGAVTGAPVGERTEGTASVVTTAVFKGVDIVRVHNVKAMKRVVAMADVIYRG
jgi:dihydropteroate synthase